MRWLVTLCGGLKPGMSLVRLKLHDKASEGRRRVRIGAEDSGTGGIIIAQPRPTDVTSIDVADIELVDQGNYSILSYNCHKVGDWVRDRRVSSLLAPIGWLFGVGHTAMTQ